MSKLEDPIRPNPKFDQEPDEVLRQGEIRLGGVSVYLCESLRGDYIEVDGHPFTGTYNEALKMAVEIATARGNRKVQNEKD